MDTNNLREHIIQKNDQYCLLSNLTEEMIKGKIINKNEEEEYSQQSLNEIEDMSSSLSSVLAKVDTEDEDLFSNIPDLDSKILKQYLNGSDEQNRPFFTRSEKQNFLNKWKDKNNLDEISTPSFSMSQYNKSNEELEFEHLFNLIKDPIDKKWIMASIDPRLPIKKKIKQLEQYILYLKEFQIKENSLNNSNGKNSDLIQNLKLNLNQQDLSESFLRMFRLCYRKDFSKDVWRKVFSCFIKRQARSN